MAIPFDLQFAWLKGVFRDPDDDESPPLWEWALTYHVQLDCNTGGEVDTDKLLLLAAHKRNSIISGGGFTSVGSGMWITQRGAVNLATDVGVSVDEEEKTFPNAAQPICSPQVAILIVGRTNSLRHQTRKWIPGIPKAFLLDGIPKWGLEGEPYSANLRDWCSLQLKEQFYFGVGDGRDVVWEPATETMRQITQIVVQAWPRTIRARTLSADPEWVDVGL